MKERLRKLLERRAKLLSDAKKIQETAVTDKGEARDMTDEEGTEFDRLMEEVDKIDVEARRLESLIRADERGAGFDRPVGRRTDPGEPVDPEDEKRQADDGVVATIERRDGSRVTITRDMAEARYSTTEYREAFRGMLIGEQRTAMQAGDVTKGGAWVMPMQMSMDYIDDLTEMVFVRQFASIEVVTSAGSLGVPTLEALPSAPEWTSEVQTAGPTEDDAMRTGRRVLTPHDLRKEIKVSNRLLRYAANAEGAVRQALVEVVSQAEENGFLNGSGIQRPLGLFVASNAGISTSRDTLSGASNALSADGFITSQMHIRQRHRNNARWIMHRDVLASARKLKDNDNQYIWRRGLEDGQSDRILNSPVHESEFAPNTIANDAYVVIYGDLRYYKIADLATIEIKRLDQPYAGQGKTGFLSESQTDGMPVLEAAFSRMKVGT